MKQSFYLFLFFIYFTSCNSQSKPGVTRQKKPEKSVFKFKEGIDYNLFIRVRVLDNTAFSQPVEAFSLLLPKGWKSSGDILWTAAGSVCAGTNKRFLATSPDGAYSFQLLPDVMRSFNSDPEVAQFQEQNQSGFCSYGEPVDAEHYLKQEFIPGELGNPKLIELKNNEAGAMEMQQKAEKYRQELMNYGASQVNFYPGAVHATVKWNDGSEGIVICGVIITEIAVPNVYNGTYSKTYTTGVTERTGFKPIICFPGSAMERDEKS